MVLPGKRIGFIDHFLRVFWVVVTKSSTTTGPDSAMLGLVIETGVNAGRQANDVKPGTIILKTRREIEIMREANRIVAEILELMSEMIEPGMTTGQLDKAADRMISKAKARAAFKGYRMRNNAPYPACICSSVNE